MCCPEGGHALSREFQLVLVFVKEVVSPGSLETTLTIRSLP